MVKYIFPFMPETYFHLLNPFRRKYNSHTHLRGGRNYSYHRMKLTFHNSSLVHDRNNIHGIQSQTIQHGL